MLVQDERKASVSTVAPTGKEEGSVAPVRMAAKPVDEHPRTAQSKDLKPHMVFVEKRLSRGMRPGASSAADKNPEKNAAAMNLHSKDCMPPLAPAFEKDAGLLEAATKVVAKQYKRTGGGDREKAKNQSCVVHEGNGLLAVAVGQVGTAPDRIFRLGEQWSSGDFRSTECI